jgi:hypothetical protein
MMKTRHNWEEDRSVGREAIGDATRVAIGWSECVWMSLRPVTMSTNDVMKTIMITSVTINKT